MKYPGYMVSIMAHPIFVVANCKVLKCNYIIICNRQMLSISTTCVDKHDKPFHLPVVYMENRSRDRSWQHSWFLKSVTSCRKHTCYRYRVSKCRHDPQGIYCQSDKRQKCYACRQREFCFICTYVCTNIRILLHRYFQCYSYIYITGFGKACQSHTKIYLEIHIHNSIQEGLKLQACNLPWMYSYVVAIRLPTPQCIGSLNFPTILDSFYQVRTPQALI